MQWKIPLFKIYSDDEDIASVTEILKRGSYWASGREIMEFEENLAAFNDRKFALTFNSGTTALFSLLLAYEIKENQEIITPSFTFIGTTNPILLVGGKPVFAEIEQYSYGLEAKKVINLINKNTRAIIPVLYAGQPCRDLAELKDIAEDQKILLIEDAAESFGSKLNGIKAGNYGDSSMFSLCQNKIITTGEGGFVLTDDEKIFERLKLIRSHGRIENDANDYFSNINESEYCRLGFNFRMSTMQAALGISQLKKINNIIEMRRNNAKYLTNNLSNLEILSPPIELSNAFHVYQMYTIKIKNKTIRDELQKHLTKCGIMSKIYFQPLHLKDFYMKLLGYRKGDLPITEKISERVLSLPIYPHMTKKELDAIINSIKVFVEKY